MQDKAKAVDFLDKEVKVFHRKWKGDKQIVTEEIIITRGVVIGIAPNSRTLLIVKDIDRGPGWDEEKQKYVGVKHYKQTPHGPKQVSWERGQNYAFDDKGEQTVHISQLELL